MKKDRRKNIFRIWRPVIALLLVLLFPLGSVAAVSGADTAAYTVKVAGNRLGIYSGKKNLSGKKSSVAYGTSARFVSGTKKLSGISYKSSDKKSLSVSRNGVISVKKAGIGKTVKVTVTAKYNKKKIKAAIRFQIKERQQEAATDGQQGSTGETASGIPETTETADKVLVVYFSRTGENYSVGRIEKGNTAILAGQISDRLKADRFEILAENPYPESYEECKTRATAERSSGARPSYIGGVADWDSYRTVFLGYPIWWGDMPMIVYHFIEDYDWNGKTVIPFNTHEGSGQSGTQSVIESRCSGAVVKQGIAIRGSVAQQSQGQMLPELETWLAGMGYDAR